VRGRRRKWGRRRGKWEGKGEQKGNFTLTVISKSRPLCAQSVEESRVEIGLILVEVRTKVDEAYYQDLLLSKLFLTVIRQISVRRVHLSARRFPDEKRK